MGTYCMYRFFNEEKLTKTNEVKGTINPDFEHERQISFKSVTNQIIDFLSNDSVMIEPWGIQKEQGMKTGNESKNTRDLMQREKTMLSPPTVGRPKSPAAPTQPSSGGGGDAKLANEIEEKIKKAKAKGMKSIPIEEIEATLASLTGN